MMTDFANMAPEDIFALGIQKGLQMVGEQGRNGDTQLAHVNPEEAEMLERRGGSGTTNPRTGLKEYFETDMGNERGRDAGVGGGSDAGAAGGGNRGDEISGGGGSDIVGHGGVGAAGDVQAGGPDVSNTPTSSGGSANPTGDAGTGQPADNRDFIDRLFDGVKAAIGGQTYGPPTGDDPGFLGAAAGLFPGIGPMMAAVRGLQAMGFESTPEYDDRIGDPNREQRDDRILTPNPRPQQQPNQTPQYSWQRPTTTPTAPGGLNFDAGMTPLQQRAAIATGGTNADAGVYRDPAIVDYYRNLATYDLTAPGGTPLAGANPLPIEMQYLRQLGADPGGTTQSFLEALAGL